MCRGVAQLAQSRVTEVSAAVTESRAEQTNGALSLGAVRVLLAELCWGGLGGVLLMVPIRLLDSPKVCSVVCEDDDSAEVLKASSFYRTGSVGDRVAG